MGPVIVRLSSLLSKVPRRASKFPSAIVPYATRRVSPISPSTVGDAAGFEHLVVPKSKFTLETPWEAIKTYTFGTGVAQHYFCGTCGISAFYVPRSNPNGYSVGSLRPFNDSYGRSTFDALTTARSLRILCGTHLMVKTGRMHFGGVTYRSGHEVGSLKRHYYFRISTQWNEKCPSLKALNPQLFI
jgi:hypothetical protein